MLAPVCVQALTSFVSLGSSEDFELPESPSYIVIYSGSLACLVVSEYKDRTVGIERVLYVLRPVVASVDQHSNVAWIKPSIPFHSRLTPRTNMGRNRNI
jgi:hypothetical protein